MMNLARWLPLPAKYKNPQDTTTSDVNTTITIMRFFMIAKTPDGKVSGGGPERNLRTQCELAVRSTECVRLTWA